MKIKVHDLPVITIDNLLIKSVSEKNRNERSLVGDKFHVKTPLNTEVDPIPLPKFTPTPEPDEREAVLLVARFIDRIFFAHGVPAFAARSRVGSGMAPDSTNLR